MGVLRHVTCSDAALLSFIDVVLSFYLHCGSVSACFLSPGTQRNLQSGSNYWAFCFLTISLLIKLKRCRNRHCVKSIFKKKTVFNQHESLRNQRPTIIQTILLSANYVLTALKNSCYIVYNQDYSLIDCFSISTDRLRIYFIFIINNKVPSASLVPGCLCFAPMTSDKTVLTSLSV